MPWDTSSPSITMSTSSWMPLIKTCLNSRRKKCRRHLQVVRSLPLIRIRFRRCCRHTTTPRIQLQAEIRRSQSRTPHNLTLWATLTLTRLTQQCSSYSRQTMASISLISKTILSSCSDLRWNFHSVPNCFASFPRAQYSIWARFAICTELLELRTCTPG